MVIAVLEIDVTLHTARRSCVDSQREGMDLGRGPDHTLEESFQGEASKLLGRAARCVRVLYCGRVCQVTTLTSLALHLCKHILGADGALLLRELYYSFNPVRRSAPVMGMGIALYECKQPGLAMCSLAHRQFCCGNASTHAEAVDLGAHCFMHEANRDTDVFCTGPWIW